MMYLPLLAIALAAPGPIKIDGTEVPASDLVSTGTVAVRADSVAVDGGRIELSPTRQKTLDAKLAAGSGTLVASLVDGSTVDTTALTFGAMKVVRNSDVWYLVNTTGAQWRQIALGPAGKGAVVKLAVVESGGQAHVFSGTKDLGTTPYEVGTAQRLGIGSPADEKNPWHGEIRDFDVVTRPLTVEELTKRFELASTAEITKSSVLTAELVDLTVVPEPQSVLPYRHALVTHEYRVVSVKSGHLKGVDVGVTIRVARWGIVSSKKTEIANLKKGDQVELTLEQYSDHPSLEHYYTVDSLPGNYTAPYLLDTARSQPGGAGQG